MAYKKISGVVQNKDNQPLSRTLYLIDRDTGNKIDSTQSGMDGKYEFRCADNNPKMVIMLADASDLSNSYCLDWIIPEDDGIVVSNTADVYGIGTRGNLGFGQAAIQNLPDTFVPLPGSEDLSSPNYGTYKYAIDGSIMIWIPKFYYKWGTGTNGLALNDCDIKGTYDFADEATANLSGYALHRSFIDGGEIKDGFFIDKYLNSKHPTMNVASSLYLGNPVPIQGVYSLSSFGLPAEPGYAINLAKFRGSSFHLMSMFQANALALLSYAHGKASTNVNYCGWFDPTYNFPKGNNYNGYSGTDYFDRTIRGLRITNTNLSSVISLAGSTYPIEKTTHNGQICGATDVNGNMQEVVLGFTCILSDYKILKESASVNSLTRDSYALSDASLFDSLGTVLSDYTSTSSYIYATSGTQIFDESTDRNSLGYRFTNMGIYKAGNKSSTNTYALSGATKPYKQNNMMPHLFGSTGDTSDSGIFYTDLSVGYYNGLSNASFRLAYYI